MNDQWARAKARYEAEGEPPRELEFAVASAIRTGDRRHIRRRAFRRTLATAAACCACFVLLVNASPNFAHAVEGVPVLGRLARIFTAEQYTVDDRDHLIDVRLPALELESHTDLEQRINTEIQARINALLDEAEERARQAREAYVATGGQEEEFIPIIINVDYEIKCQNSQYLSFLITETETLASAYTQTYTYNIDLEAGREITPRDILGPDYMEIANAAVRAGIAQRSLDPDNVYFTAEKGGFQSIADDQRFYINQKGNPVVVFDKYEIAPGYMGTQEFEIVP